MAYGQNAPSLGLTSAKNEKERNREKIYSVPVPVMKMYRVEAVSLSISD